MATQLLPLVIAIYWCDIGIDDPEIKELGDQATTIVLNTDDTDEPTWYFVMPEGYTEPELLDEADFDDSAFGHDGYLAPQHEPTCTNPEMHSKFADRGIEDQCPHCICRGDDR